MKNSEDISPYNFIYKMVLISNVDTAEVYKKNVVYVLSLLVYLISCLILPVCVCVPHKIYTQIFDYALHT
jgi:hypothetical protein